MAGRAEDMTVYRGDNQDPAFLAKIRKLSSERPDWPRRLMNDDGFFRVLRAAPDVARLRERLTSNEAPGGIGEVATAIAAPALGSAILAATGVRMRRLQLDGKALTKQGG
jgi:hypothetical protein